MQNKTLISKFISFILLMFPIPVLAAGYELEYEVIKKGIDGSEERATSKIILMPNQVAKSYHDVTSISDLDSHNITYIYHNKKTFERSTMYARVKTREDFMNDSVDKLLSMISKPSDDSKWKQFAKEALYGMKENEYTSKSIKHKITEKQHKFTFLGAEVARFTLSDHVISPELKKAFRIYLMYDHRLHPEIRKSLLKHNKFPALLSYTYKPHSDVESKWEFRLAKITQYNQNKMIIPAGYTKKYHGKSIQWLDELDLKTNSKAKMLSAVDYEKEVIHLMEKKKFLDAYLALREYYQHYGIYNKELNDKVDALGAHDKNLQKLLKAIDNAEPKKVEELFPGLESAPQSLNTFLKAYSEIEPFDRRKEAIKIITALKKQNLRHRYILDIYISLLYHDMQLPDNALKHLKEALYHNPFMAGVYISAGRLSLSSHYQTKEAWACFALAKKVNHNHPWIKKDISSIESELLKEHPEFF